MEDKTSAGNVAAESVAENATSAKKATKSTKAKAKRLKSSHPPTSEMVTSAIKELKDRKGSSLQAIKKYIASTYKVDGEKLAPFIRKYLKAAVTSGSVVQTKGKGASGSFKLAAEKSDNKVKKVQRRTKKAEPKKAQSVEKKSAIKKSVASKKASPSKKTSGKKASQKKVAPKSAVAKSKVATEAKSMSKVKKTVKSPAAKTKTPKPKKAATAKAIKSPAKK